MAKPKTLDDGDRKLLAALGTGEYQYNAWTKEMEAAAPYPLNLIQLGKLQKMGFVAGEGRGKFRQWWITPEGIAARDGGKS
jgi:hypothetical protein